MRGEPELRRQAGPDADRAEQHLARTRARFCVIFSVSVNESKKCIHELAEALRQQASERSRAGGGSVPRKKNRPMIRNASAAQKHHRGDGADAHDVEPAPRWRGSCENSFQRRKREEDEQQQDAGQVEHALGEHRAEGAGETVRGAAGEQRGTGDVGGADRQDDRQHVADGVGEERRDRTAADRRDRGSSASGSCAAAAPSTFAANPTITQPNVADSQNRARPRAGSHSAGRARGRRPSEPR